MESQSSRPTISPPVVVRESGEETTRGTKRQRSTAACMRCKARKQKCTNTFPCTNCASANVECIFSGQGYPLSYVHSLEERVAYLETKLQAGDRDASDHHQDLNNNNTNNRLSPSSSSHATPTQVIVAANEEDQPFPLVSLYAATEQSFLGSTSGYPLSRLLHSVVNKHLLIGVGPKLSPHSEANPAVPAKMPSGEIADLLVSTYWAKFQARHPFLWKNEINDLNFRRQELYALRGELDAPELYSPCLEQNSSRKLHVGLFKLYMIYAISARYLQLSGQKLSETTPEQYYNAASREIDIVLSVKDLDTIESLVLLVLYQLRSPSYPGMWHLIRHAMTSCIECGLHRKSRLASCKEDERRKRLFWCVYGLDRAVAMALGRPHSISERDVDADLPANVDMNTNDEDNIRQAIEKSRDNPSQVTNMSTAIHIFRLKIIESRIHEVIYAARRTEPVPNDEYEKLQAQLTDWKANIPERLSENREEIHSMHQFHMLQYWKSVRLLYLPRITAYSSSSQEFRTCILAAGQICQLQKQIHQSQVVSWSLLGLHATYLAGLTLIYGFWISRHIFDFRFSSDIRACSTVLYIIAERWPAATKYRDAFEELVANLIEASSPDQATPEAEGPVSHARQVLQAESSQLPDVGSAFNTAQHGGWQMDDDPYFHPITTSHMFGETAGEQAWEMFEDLIAKGFRNQVGGIHLGVPSYFAA